MTLDVHATLFPDELDSVATTMDILVFKKNDDGKGAPSHADRLTHLYFARAGTIQRS